MAQNPASQSSISPSLAPARPVYSSRYVLKKNIAAQLFAGSPFVYRDAIEKPNADVGSIVRIEEPDGRFVAAAFAEEGPIAARVVSLRDRVLDEDFFVARMERAIALREKISTPETDAFRLFYGEADGIPGLVVDVYGDAAVMQFDGSASYVHRELLLAALLRATAEKPYGKRVFFRSGKRGQKKFESAHGDASPERFYVSEYGMKLLVDLQHGQKTGLFLDHRESRAWVRRIAKGTRLVNLYGYTGGFSIAAALGGASEVHTVDVAQGALDFAREGFEANGVGHVPHETHCMDVMEYLDRRIGSNQRFDVVVSDPPSFAPNEESVQLAIRAYRNLHRSCLRVVEEGGILVAASCSSHIPMATFEQTLVDAATKQGKILQTLGKFGAPFDHPRILGIPHGDYLKVVFVRVLSR